MYSSFLYRFLRAEGSEKPVNFIIKKFAPYAFLLVGMLFYSSQSIAQCASPITFTAPGTDTFFVPAGVTSITVDVWGGGGGGARRTSNGGGGGGGGGAFSRSILTVAPGQSYRISVGDGGGSNTAGEDSWIALSTNLPNRLALAKGGLSPGNNSNIGAAGGQASDGIGTVTYSGGNGANGVNFPGRDRRGGGGGGAAGPDGAGAAGSGRFGGSNGNGGGDGGTAPDNNSLAGNDGSNIGGGGSGAARSGGTLPRIGGSGAAGRVIITYTCPPIPPGAEVVDDGATTGNVIVRFTSNGSWTPPQGLLEFNVLVVGGGGGGGRGNSAGGGGGGGITTDSWIDVNAGIGFLGTESFPIVVGAGGDGSNNTGNQGGTGATSSFDNGGSFSTLANGGGGGGSLGGGARSGANGTSGGGGAFESSEIGGTGSAGNNGATGFNGGGGTRAGGGGGGAGGVGTTGNAINFFNLFFLANGGDGGAGTSLPGFPGLYAGGGGGAASGGSAFFGYPFAGTGGSGGGGDASNGGNGTSGTANSGSGGGAGGGARGGSGGSGVVIITYPLIRILPVEYAYIEAELVQGKREVNVKWATAKEWENRGFEIQRSIGNVDDWKPIGFIDGVGWSDAKVEYNFIDYNPPMAGGLVYYRLKQIDFDGDTELSKVVFVRAPQKEKTDGTWIIYPNPVRSQSVTLEALDLTNYNGEEIGIKVVNPLGQQLNKQGYDIDELSSWMSGIFSKSLKGVYMVEISWGGYREYHKILSQP